MLSFASCLHAGCSHKAAKVKKKYGRAGSAGKKLGGRFAGIKKNGDGRLPGTWALTLTRSKIGWRALTLTRPKIGGWALTREWALMWYTTI